MEKYELEHIEKLRKIAPECMVLLKSDGSFPISEPGKIALYGNGARHTIKGGTGSGDVNVKRFVTVEEGLENAGFTITSKAWLDGYDIKLGEAREKFNAGIKERLKGLKLHEAIFILETVMPEPDYDLPLDAEGDTAIYVLTRNSGEGADRTVVPGDFELSETEIRDILRLQDSYEKFMLVLNVGGVTDLSPVADKVRNILLLSQTGMTIGDSFADVLLGKSYPSGKLTTTWAAWDDYCHVGSFGDADDVNYDEGIYVGYRYFDTVGKSPIFPFGHGLSYTDFAFAAESVTLDGADVTVYARVTNIGKRPGKEVMQLYVSVPSGRFDQPAQSLAAFAKTGELQPGEEQIISLRFAMDELASFDDKISCALLERGDYVLRLGNSSRNTAVCGVVRLADTTIVERLSESGAPATPTWSPDDPVRLPSPEPLRVLELNSVDVMKLRPAMPEVDSKAAQIARRLTDEQLAKLCVGGYDGAGGGGMIGNSGIAVAGAAGETANILKDRGIEPLIMADGPAGLRLSREYGVDENGVYAIGGSGPFDGKQDMMPEEMLAEFKKYDAPERHGEIHEQNCSALPIGTALAQSWNTALCEQCGDIVGEEMERFGVNLWLAPAMNIHRLPLCGRNFEYFSEDPLISGKVAAALTRGVQKHPGCGVTLKHFACNNQEFNRLRSNSVLSQRALRDIYLRGFRIAVEESQPMAVMTSYNLINGEHSSQREDLLETVLRGEWGFKGMVMSDWVMPDFNEGEDVHKYPGACSNGSIGAGNDLMMPGCEKDVQNILNALKDKKCEYPLTRERLEKSAARVIALSMKLNKARKESKN